MKKFLVSGAFFVVMLMFFSASIVFAQDADESSKDNSRFQGNRKKVRKNRMGFEGKDRKGRKGRKGKRGFRVPEDVRKAIEALSDEKKLELTKARELISTYRELATMSRKEKKPQDAVKWISEIKNVKMPDGLPENVLKFVEQAKKMIDVFIFETYIEADDAAAAEKYLDKALEGGMEPMQAAMICRRAARMFKKKKNNEKAREYLMKAVKYFQK